MYPVIELIERSLDLEQGIGYLTLVVKGDGIEIEVTVFTDRNGIDSIRNAVCAWRAAHKERDKGNEVLNELDQQ